MLAETQSQGQKPTVYDEIQKNKQAHLQFQSKMKLELKQAGQVNPQAIEVLRGVLKQFEALS